MFKRIISLGLVTALLWNSISSSEATEALLAPLTTPSHLPQFDLLPPPDLGHIADYYNAPSAFPLTQKGRKPLIILIQDLHAHYGVQKSIAGLLHVLSQRIQPNDGRKDHSQLPFAIATEGSEGRIDNTLLALYPDRSVKLTAADYLMREGEITGADYFTIARGLPHAMTGIENNRYYEIHRDLFRQTFQARNVLVQRLRLNQQDLQKIAPSFISSRLRTLRRQQSSLDRGELSAEDFLLHLLQTCHSGNSDDLVSSQELKQRFPVLQSFALQSGILESAATPRARRTRWPSRFEPISPEALRALTADFLTGIQSTLTLEEKANLSVLAKDVSQTPYYLYIRDLLQAHQLFLAAPPALAKHLEYFHTSQTLGMDAVNHEIQEFSFLLQERLARTRPEEEFVQVEHDLSLLIRLADLQATEHDVRAFAPHLDRFLALSRALLKASTSETIILRQLISSSIDFYTMAILRNQPMVENTLSLIGVGAGFDATPEERQTRQVADRIFRQRLNLPSKRASSKSKGSAPVVAPIDKRTELQAPVPETAVLIAGGFHTEMLTELLRKKQISYLVITPTVASISDADRELYLKRLNGEVLSEWDILNQTINRSSNLANAVHGRADFALSAGRPASVGAILAALLSAGAMVHHVGLGQYWPHFVQNLESIPSLLAVSKEWLEEHRGIVFTSLTALGGTVMRIQLAQGPVALAAAHHASVNKLDDRGYNPAAHAAFAAEYSVDQLVETYNRAVNAIFEGKQPGITKQETALMKELSDRGFVSGLETLATSNGSYPIYTVLKHEYLVFASRTTQANRVSTEHQVKVVTRMSVTHLSNSYTAGLRALFNSLLPGEKQAIVKRVGGDLHSIDDTFLATFAGYAIAHDFPDLEENRQAEISHKVQELEDKIFIFLNDSATPKSVGAIIGHSDSEIRTAQVLLPSGLRRFANDQQSLHASGQTVAAALESVAPKGSSLGKQLFGANGNLRGFVHVYVNDQHVRSDMLATTLLPPDAVISFAASISGGSGRTEGLATLKAKIAEALKTSRPIDLLLWDALQLRLRRDADAGRLHEYYWTPTYFNTTLQDVGVSRDNFVGLDALKQQFDAARNRVQRVPNSDRSPTAHLNGVIEEIEVIKSGIHRQEVVSGLRKKITQLMIGNQEIPEPLLWEAIQLKVQEDVDAGKVSESYWTPLYFSKILESLGMPYQMNSQFASTREHLNRLQNAVNKTVRSDREPVRHLLLVSAEIDKVQAGFVREGSQVGLKEKIMRQIRDQGKPEESSLWEALQLAIRRDAGNGNVPDNYWTPLYFSKTLEAAGVPYESIQKFSDMQHKFNQVQNSVNRIAKSDRSPTEHLHLVSEEIDKIRAGFVRQNDQQNLNEKIVRQLRESGKVDEMLLWEALRLAILKDADTGSLPEYYWTPNYFSTILQAAGLTYQQIWELDSMQARFNQIRNGVQRSVNSDRQPAEHLRAVAAEIEKIKQHSDSAGFSNWTYIEGAATLATFFPAQLPYVAGALALMGIAGRYLYPVIRQRWADYRRRRALASSVVALAASERAVKDGAREYIPTLPSKIEVQSRSIREFLMQA